MATSRTELTLSKVPEKAELFKAAAHASGELKRSMDTAHQELLRITNPDQKNLLRRGLGLLKRVLANGAETNGSGDDIFVDLRANVLHMKAVLEKLMPLVMEEVAIKEQLESLSDAVNQATTPEDREAALNELMALIRTKSEEVLGPNPFKRDESSLPQADIERRWQQAQQIIPVVSAGLDVQIATAMVFRDIYDQVSDLYWLLLQARDNALLAQQMAVLAEETAGMEIAGYNQAVLYIATAIETAEKTMAMGDQLGHMLETPNPALGLLNGVILDEARAKAARIRDEYTQKRIE